jgi:hypothetical protein
MKRAEWFYLATGCPFSASLHPVRFMFIKFLSSSKEALIYSNANKLVLL